MTFEHKTTGQPLQIFAAEYNACLDAAKAYQKGLMHIGSESNAIQSTTMLVKNSSGTDVPLGGVLALDAPLISPTDNLTEFQTNLALNGLLPDWTHSDKLAIAAEYIVNGQIGKMIIDGIAVCQVYVNYELDKYADMSHSATGANAVNYLYSGGTGAQILWKESGTGAKWAVINMNHVSPIKWAKVTATPRGAGCIYANPITGRNISGADTTTEICLLLTSFVSYVNISGTNYPVAVPTSYTTNSIVTYIPIEPDATTAPQGIIIANDGLAATPCVYGVRQMVMINNILTEVYDAPRFLV
jgi:hypothetical protein